MTSCELNKIFLGEVAAIQNYGAFVRIPGCKQQGLIHKSQVSSVRVDDVSEILQRGDKVWCKVVNIDEDGKIGLSMKFVNQGNGKDLDPNGVEWQRNEQKKKTMGEKPGKRAIELEAVLNTNCKQCGTKGHLASDCFATPDGKRYELLPEIEDEIVSPVATGGSDKLENKEIKSKKLKRKKKSKKSKQDASSSDDDSSDQEKKRKKKKKKKKKHSKEAKKRKRKQSESETDSSDADDDKNKHSKKCKHSRSKYSD